MELLGKLGVDAHLLLAHSINFGLLVALLSFFLYKPLLRRIEEDEQKLKEAEHIRANIEREKDAEAVLLRRAHDRAEAVVREAE
jgi:F0F1-type ATP synthase membrane subunit b/b'